MTLAAPTGIARYLSRADDSPTWRAITLVALVGVFLVDLLVPLGFNVANLYLPVTFAAIMSRDRHFVLGVTGASVGLTILGVPLSPSPAPSVTWAMIWFNRGFAILGIAVAGVLAASLLRAIQELTRANAAFDASLQRYRDLANSMPMIVWTAKPDGTLNFATGALAAYTGASPTTLAQGWQDALHPEDREACLRAWGEAIRSGEPYAYEMRLRRADGSYRWHLARAVAVRRANGQIHKWYGSATDIHDQKMLEQTTREVVQRLNNTLESITDGFLSMDRNWRLVYLNREAERLVRRNREELLGQYLWAAFPEAVGTIFETEYRRAMDTQTVVSLEEFYPPLDTWFEIHLYPSAEGLSINFRDISQRRRADAQLRLLETAVARLNDIVLITEAEPFSTPGPKIVFVNGAFERRTGYTREEVLGRSPRFLQGPATQRAELDRIRAALDRWQPIRAELINYTKAGEPFWIELDIVPIADDKGVYTHWVAVERDVSDRHALEEQLRQSQRLEAVGQLTGGVAHDFNNLLTVILGNAELLNERLAAQPELAALAGMVVHAAERGADLTQQLLAFARKQALEPQAVDVNAQVSACSVLLRRTLGEHIQIEFVRGAGLWTALVDPTQLDNALLNLCLNARDAMPQGGRLIIETANARLGAEYVEQQPDVAAGDYVMLVVSDTGTGIAPQHLGRVFEPFFTTKEKGKGTGLGLAMTYGFVKQSGGHVVVYSEPGHGTTVKVYLPRAAHASEPVRRAPPQAARGHESVLLVEDDALVRRYAQEQLEALGYQVLVADGGAQALELLRTAAAIDLLFTDVVMPGISGRELADAARQLRPGLKVLFTSGYTDNAIVHHGRLDAGVQLLTKPYRRDDLARRLREVLAA